MAKNSVIWSENAMTERKNIFKYWNERIGSNLYSTKLLFAIRGRIKVIKENPFAFKANEFQDIRECAIGNYSIFYKVMENEIIVTSFWDNRQDPDKLLEILEKNIKTT